jgi:hypothetical protein
MITGEIFETEKGDLITDGEVHKMNTCSESRAELTAITTPR